MEVSTMATIYGCEPYFGLCSDRDLMSLSMEGTQPFLDWIGWEKTNVCHIEKNFITWVRPEPDERGGRSSGSIADACGESNGVQWGSCDFTLDDFALLRRHGPIRNATRDNVRYCEAQPRYRLDGTPITSDAEYDMKLVLEAQTQDLKRMLITGNSSYTGQFNGLDQLVKTGYVNSKGNLCSSMDSIVIDWNGNDLDGGSGMTWNGKPIDDGYDFIDVLLAAVRRVKDRISMAPQLSGQMMSPGDMVIVAPSHLLRCLLDAFTCWSICPGVSMEEYFSLNTTDTYKARDFRDRLNGGLYNFGKIYLDQFEIPLLAYPWELIKSPTLSDMYVLTGNIGPVKVIQGQYNDLSTVPTTYPEAAYSYTDGGKLLTWLERDKTCVYREVEHQPRLLMWAPWAQIRIQDVACRQPGGVISPDPWETSFFPESSFIPA